MRAPVRLMRTRSSGRCGLWSDDSALAMRPPVALRAASMARESPTLAHAHAPPAKSTATAVVPDTAVSTPARAVAGDTKRRCMTSKESRRASTGAAGKAGAVTHTSGKLVRA